MRDVWLRDISLLFRTAVPYVPLAGFEFLILLPLHPKCCVYRLLPLQLWIFFKCSIWGSPLSYSNARQFSFFLPTSFKCWCSVSALAWSNLSCHSHQQNESSYVDFFSCILILQASFSRIAGTIMIPISMLCLYLSLWNLLYVYEDHRLCLCYRYPH